MTKFKVGDRVRVLAHKAFSGSGQEEYQGGKSVGLTGYVERADNDTVPYCLDEKSATPSGSRNYMGWYAENELELVTTNEDKPMARRTFKQIKDSFDIRKGAIWQEQCEDGTQPYECINQGDFYIGNNSAGTVSKRTLIEDNPAWFIEVFQVEPQYLTAEELKAWDEFKRTKLAKPAKAAKGGKPSLTKNGKRLGRPRKAK